MVRHNWSGVFQIGCDTRSTYGSWLNGTFCMKLSREQFEAMAMEQSDLLFRVALRLTHNHSAAEDLVQDTYVRAIRFWSGFDLQQYGIKPWLLRILHNIHTTQFHRDQKQPASMDDAHLDALSDKNNPGISIGSANIWEGMDEQLVKAVNSLPEEYRSVLLLWAVEELSYKEISEVVEVPIGTVMSRLHRGRQRLAEQLQGYARENRLLSEPKP